MEHDGWDRGFIAVIIAAGIGTVTFLPAWPAKSHGYATDKLRT